MSEIFKQIEDTINSNDVVLYMKGNKDFPQCGFSAVVLQILNKLGVDFVAIDVLSDPEIRQGIKEFTDWPTIPQLYIKGEFIGGCDIVKDMYSNGELEDLLKINGIVN